MNVPTAARLTDLTVDIATRPGRRAPVVRTLTGVDLRVRAGEVTALIGESGCGKSLVAAALCGLLPPGSRVTGRITIAGADIAHHDEKRWRRLRGRHIGLVPQSAATSFTPVRPVGDQLAEVCHRLRADRTPIQLLATVGLTADVAARYPHELSGGMAQRVAIAAALAGRPGLLLADEPTTGLDPDNSAMVWRLLGEAAAEGAGVLVITHDLPALMRAQVCAEVALMRAGTVVAQEPLDVMSTRTDGYVGRFFSPAVL